MQRNLTLEHLKDYIPSKNDRITKHRPDCFYVPRPPPRRKYETPIPPPDRNFFKLMATLDVYLWIVVKKNVKSHSKSSDKDMYDKIFQCYKSVKTLTGYEKLPICESYEECMHWIQNFPSQIVIFEDIFDELFEKLNGQVNACGFHVISLANVEIAEEARKNKKIKNIYDDEVYILKIVKQNMQRLAITKQTEQKSGQENGVQNQRVYIKNAIFPNFIRLSKHDKSEHNQYRLHLIGLRKLTSDEKLDSKDKFIESSRQKFPNDQSFIQQYNSNSYADPSQILRFYTQDCFFYRVLNSTLRIAKNTEEFFSIGEPFNKVFDAIKREYDQSEKDQNLVLYRGADLTNSQCLYLYENIGRYIEINGFISTSKNFQTAKSFAKQRKSRSIFKIKLTKSIEKYKELDYGYVDLSARNYSAYDEDEVLFNALNVFKVVGRQNLQEFDLYVLEYGTIFHVLEQDPNKLEKNDKFAYYSFKELREMNEQVRDIGEVYLRTFEPEKAVQIYEYKLQKMKESIDTSKGQQYEQTLFKAANAHAANGQPDKAIKYYQNCLKNEKNQHKKKARSGIKSKAQINQRLKIASNLSEIQMMTDQYEQSQQSTRQGMSEISQEKQKQWNNEYFYQQIKLKLSLAKSKKQQMLFKEQYHLLQKIFTLLQQGLSKIEGIQDEAVEHKKIQMKMTQVLVLLTEAGKPAQMSHSQMSNINKSFSKVYKNLTPILQNQSFDQGLLFSRYTQISKRTQQFSEQRDVQIFQIADIQKSAEKVASRTSQTDSVLPQIYQGVAQICLSSKTNPDIAGAIEARTKELKHSTLIHGKDDPRPLATKMEIAIIQRDDKNTTVALQLFYTAYHTQVYKTDTKYALHAKILFNMAQAYTDMGQDGLALKSLKQSHDILERRLSKNDFQQSVLKFKVKLRMGRIYTSTSLRGKGNLQLAQKYLWEYHKFINKTYTQPHTDRAMSFRCLGALYSVMREYQKSKTHFQDAIKMYEQTKGGQSSQVGEMKSNLAIVYAQLKEIRKATKILLEARQIFGKIYKDLKKQNPYEHQSTFIKAEIETLDKKYRKAIQLCEQSKQLQREFLQSKKRFQNFKFLKSEFVVANRNDSFNMRMESNKPQVKSGIVKYGNEGEIERFNSSSIWKQKSENYGPLNSLINYMTEHAFKCEFHICDCLIYLKEHKEAMRRLQKLRDILQERMNKEKINPLFKDTLHSKKSMYFDKSQRNIKKLKEYLEKKGNQQNGKGSSGSIDDAEKELFREGKDLDLFT